MPELLRCSADGPVAHVRLQRPDVRNALNTELIEALRSTFAELAQRSAIRAIVLSGEGTVFCGGADIAMMRESLELRHAENVAGARALSEMYRAIDACPKPVIAKIHGAALGGGAGLVAVCDIAIAATDTTFGFTEVKLGIIPAVISPFVLAKIGASHARALFLTGERFDARRALAIGLVHEVVVGDALDLAVERVVGEIISAGPQAIAAVKQLIARIRETSYAESKEMTAEAIAAQRVSDEGQEGLRAFLDRRDPAWKKP
ncbi:MAG TPA: enoyl-CoA hydratase-related protein [Candidatus Rubrimentiphilum sp.]|nr:enoyl-CoA hydratase-related protein [Candidatus Rubrimentiphilum sp.]